MVPQGSNNWFVKFNGTISKAPKGFNQIEAYTNSTGLPATVGDSQILIAGRKIYIHKLYVSDHEVTQGEYEKYCAYAGPTLNGPTYTAQPLESSGKGPNYPVYYVSWGDAILYCNLRSMNEGLNAVYSVDGETDPTHWPQVQSTTIDGETKYCTKYDVVVPEIATAEMIGMSDTVVTTKNGWRLPTKIEWEYLAREGNLSATGQYKYSGSNTASAVAWYFISSGAKHEVKLKAPNALGLYDMSGNVDEFCWDKYCDVSSITADTPHTGVTVFNDTEYYRRARRGGNTCTSYGNDHNCEIIYRSTCSPKTGNGYWGFRIVRNVD